MKIIKFILSKFKTAIFLIILISSLFLYASYGKGIYIVTSSDMENTIINGDVIVVEKWKYIPQFSDVVLIGKSNPTQAAMTARIIAVAGQTVKITQDGVFVDNIKINEPYIKTSSWEKINAKEIEISDGFVYILGDNRNIALDSREFGAIPETDIVGKVVFRIFPPLKKF